jgi:hypothetical protein
MGWVKVKKPVWKRGQGKVKTLPITFAKTGILTLAFNPFMESYTHVILYGAVVIKLRD